MFAVHAVGHHGVVLVAVLTGSLSTTHSSAVGRTTTGCTAVRHCRSALVVLRGRSHVPEFRRGRNPQFQNLTSARRN
jgi:hypothetical protein